MGVKMKKINLQEVMTNDLDNTAIKSGHGPVLPFNKPTQLATKFFEKLKSREVNGQKDEPGFKKLLDLLDQITTNAEEKNLSPVQSIFGQQNMPLNGPKTITDCIPEFLRQVDSHVEDKEDYPFAIFHQEIRIGFYSEGYLLILPSQHEMEPILISYQSQFELAIIQIFSLLIGRRF